MDRLSLVVLIVSVVAAVIGIYAIAANGSSPWILTPAIIAGVWSLVGLVRRI